jgi:hypothetical protein
MYIFNPKGVFLIVKSILQKEPIPTWKIDLSNNQQLPIKKNWTENQQLIHWHFHLSESYLTENMNQWCHFQISYLFKNQNVMQQSAM